MSNLPLRRPELVTSPGAQAALRLLQGAHCAASQAGRDVWQFAVDLAELRAAGASGSDLRSLLCEGYVAHAEELCDPGAAERTFRTLPSLVLLERSCFVLTPAGLALAETLAGAANGHPGAAPFGPPDASRRPRWDKDLRELRWRGLLVKRFVNRADSQELILEALEEEDWPPRIDDPLPREPGQDASQRLHDAVRGLNRNQVHPVLVFRRDGTGQGVIWAERPPSPLRLRGASCAREPSRA